MILNLFDPHLIWFRDVKYFELEKKPVNLDVFGFPFFNVAEKN